jgi:2-phosphosulfolactate phosphatase
MNVEVYLASNNLTEEALKGRTAVVIDVLRTSSTIVTALQNGARAFVPVADMAEAGKIAANLDPASYLMGGERGGEKIKSYHLGNAPHEYSRAVVAEKTIILNTTNGTGAILNARSAEHVVIGCFLNASRVVQFVQEHGLDVVLICAGWRNHVSLEDTLCAGLFLHHFWAGTEPEGVSDAAHIAFTQYQYDKTRLAATIHRSSHAVRLRAQEQHQDIDYCLQMDAVPLLPLYRDSRVVLVPEPRNKDQKARARSTAPEAPPPAWVSLKETE